MPQDEFMTSQDIFFRVLDEIGSPTRSIPIYKTPDRVQELPQDIQYLMKSKDARAVTGFRWNGLVNRYFCHPFLQLLLVAYWNHERNWGFTWEDFQQILRTIPSWPEKELVAITLVPCLEDVKNGVKGVERTFHGLWQVAASMRRQPWRWEGYNEAGPERLYLLKGIKHSPGLRWEVIDLGCKCNERPEDVRNADKSPHAGVLASAALHPEWINAMNGKDVPYVWAPGYEVNVPGWSSWVCVPRLNFVRIYDSIALNYGLSFDPEVAAPSFL